MKFEDHCNESIILFGTPFKEVHKWLDEFAGVPGIEFKHRQIRHHLKGVEEIRKLFGEVASDAGLQHIKSDLKQEGWTDKDRVPIDQEDYKKMGFY